MARDDRFISGDDLASLIDPGRNLDAAAYLAKHQPSCHSDTGEALIRSAEKCGDWIAFSPSFLQCRYVALVTNRTIFSLGLGQSSVLYRLPDDVCPTALATGAAGAPEIGPGWVRFELFRADWPAPDLPFWTLKAYDAARALAV